MTTPRPRLLAACIALACMPALASAQHVHADAPARQAASSNDDAENTSQMDHAQMDHAQMDHAQMDHAQMDHSQMDHSQMDHAAAPRTPLPPVTRADMDAAFAPLHAHAMHGAGINHYVLLDQLEAWDTARGSGQAWNANAWIGGDIDRLWVRSEGGRRRGRSDDSGLEMLYGHAIAPWWDLLVGLRQDIGSGHRSWAALGVQGLAPYRFEVSATLYLGEGGGAALRMEGEYDVLLTNRLILQPRVEADVLLADDRRRDVGAGLDSVEAGVRLRYEITRRFAPYIGWNHARRFGDAADHEGAEGRPSRESRFVAGVRIWF